MKVVLFCGGQGLRMREFSESIPKPMVNIGYRPILWHVMKYYAYYGHKRFYSVPRPRRGFIKNYFLNYNECISNDFVLSGGGKKLQLFNSDIDDWNITFADTGVSSNIGQRLKTGRKIPRWRGCSFSQITVTGFTDLPPDRQIEHFNHEGKVASFLCVRPNLSFHFIKLKPDGNCRVN